MANEAALPPIEISSEDKKGDIRNKVWTYLQKNKLTTFPYPPFRRIPNFVTSQEACAKIIDFAEFTSAKCVKVDPDKPLQEARYQALKAGKTLLVPTPRLIYNFLNEIIPPTDGDEEILKSCASQKGVLNYSKSLDLDASKKVDLIIVGAVAISQLGWRIGKGSGYSDLEYAMMLTLGLVTSATKIIAIVHDCQVLEDIPEDLFEMHDVPVDIIITPTRIIDCSEFGGSRIRPNAIYWNLLDEERLKQIPVLRSIRYLEWKANKNVALKGEENPSDLQPENITALMQEADEARKKSLENNSKRNHAFRQRRGRGGRFRRESHGKEHGNAEEEEKNEKREDRPRRARGGRRFFGQVRKRPDSAKNTDPKKKKVPTATLR